MQLGLDNDAVCCGFVQCIVVLCWVMAFDVFLCI
jgi:hypothetical protein